MIDLLIIEPNEHLVQPYIFVPSFYQIERVETSERAIRRMASYPPELVMISANLSLPKQLPVLEKLKEVSFDFVPGLIYVVDWSRPAWLPQMTWGGKLGICHTFSTPKEIQTQCEKVRWKQK